MGPSMAAAPGYMSDATDATTLLHQPCQGTPGKTRPAPVLPVCRNWAAWWEGLP